VKTYRPTGPTLLSAGEMTATLTRVLGRRVRHVEMPMWMFHKALRALGIDAFQHVGLRHYIEEHKRGTFELGAPTSHVRDVAGVEPEDFETIARRYATLPEARRTFGNRLPRALGLRPHWSHARLRPRSVRATRAAPDGRATDARRGRAGLAGGARRRAHASCAGDRGSRSR
jgi:hypothetical protein